MKEKLGTLVGVILFTSIFCGITFLTLSANNSKSDEHTKIKIVGNNILSEQDYLLNSQLDDIKNFSNLSLSEIKSRIEKDAYISYTEVYKDGEGTVNIKVYEKEIVAVLLIPGGPYLITSKFDLIPMNKNSDISNLPVIINATLSEEEINNHNTKNPQIICAFKIIDAVKFVGEDMYKDLAEINLRSGGEVIVKFSDVSFPVILGRNAEGEKILVLSCIWNGIKNQDELFKNCNYVDLRFSNKIFIGNPVSIEISG